MSAALIIAAVLFGSAAIIAARRFGRAAQITCDTWVLEGRADMLRAQTEDDWIHHLIMMDIHDRGLFDDGIDDDDDGEGGSGDSLPIIPPVAMDDAPPAPGTTAH